MASILGNKGIHKKGQIGVGI